MRNAASRMWPAAGVGGAAHARESVTLSAGLNQIHSLFRGPGVTLFGSTRTSPANLIKWADYKNLASYSTLSFSGETAGTANSADSAVYDSTTGFIYVCFTAYLNVDTFFHNKVAKVNPSDLSYSILIDDPIDDTFTTGTPCIETDGTYLYMGTGSNNVAALRRYNLTTGAFVDQVLITGRKRAHTITKDSSNLYLGGPTTALSSGPPWAAKVPKAMSAATSISLNAANVFTVTDDSTLLSGSYWVAHENDSTGKISKVATDMSTTTDYDTGTAADSFGITTDGTNLFVVKNTSPGKIVKMNPADGSVISTTTLQSGENSVNELVFFPETGEYVACCFLSPAIVIRDAF